jgi:hypothetical protein
VRHGGFDGDTNILDFASVVILGVLGYLRERAEP